MTGRVHSSVKTALCLVNVALDLAINGEGRMSWLKLAYVHNHVIFDLQSLYDKLDVTLAQEPFVTRLTASLWVQDSLVKHDHLLPFSDAFCRSVHTQYFASAR